MNRINDEMMAGLRTLLGATGDQKREIERTNPERVSFATGETPSVSISSRWGEYTDREKDAAFSDLGWRFKRRIRLTLRSGDATPVYCEDRRKIIDVGNGTVYGHSYCKSMDGKTCSAAVTKVTSAYTSPVVQTIREGDVPCDGLPGIINDDFAKTTYFGSHYDLEARRVAHAIDCFVNKEKCWNEFWDKDAAKDAKWFANEIQKASKLVSLIIVP